MYTSDTDKAFRNALIYLLISLAVAFFGAVYEHFSFGVYSGFMIYAFAIPLTGGTLPHLLWGMKNKGRRAVCGGYNVWYHAGIATLTIGSIMKGVLDIYGTTNRLLIIYPISGVILLAMAISATIISSKKTRITA